ncbi:class A beta-lactamase [Algoriphagus resistens]|uniref:class A beta-lactamase n=1 Tax=Algoriphagus resistens TaxID=1750590 RepID=UPI00071681C3|nr:class A beta-lactamase [Algoriphagus resistens]
MKKSLLVNIGFIISALLCLAAKDGYSQNSLYSTIQQISDTSSGQLGVSILHLESGEKVSLNGDKKFPMQSVYKFPIAMAVLQEIDKEKFSLDDSIAIHKSEYIPKAGHSPIRDQFPEGVTMTLRDILAYNVSHSDGTACDVLLRILGGTEKAEKKIHGLGIKDIAISTTEMVQVAHDTIQYQNWSTPDAMNDLLVVFFKGKDLSENSRQFLLKLMSYSNPWFDRRIKGLLPKETPLVHKTGTAATYNGLTRATNDVGIITLPDQSHLVISVFISDSYDSQSKRESIIASVSKAAFDHWSLPN